VCIESQSEAGTTDGLIDECSRHLDVLVGHDDASGANLVNVNKRLYRNRRSFEIQALMSASFIRKNRPSQSSDESPQMACGTAFCEDHGVESKTTRSTPTGAWVIREDDAYQRAAEFRFLDAGEFAWDLVEASWSNSGRTCGTRA